MNKSIGVALIILACVLGYLGISEFSNSTASVEALGVEISASDEGGQMTAFIYLGLAIISLFGGIKLIGNK